MEDDNEGGRDAGRQRNNRQCGCYFLIGANDRNFCAYTAKLREYTHALSLERDEKEPGLCLDLHLLGTGQGQTGVNQCSTKARSTRFDHRFQKNLLHTS